MSKSVYVVGEDKPVSRMFFERHYAIINDLEKADIICWIGGADINPALYDQDINEEVVKQINNKHDERDLKAWQDSRPDQFLVGICRGGQFLNVMNGGSLYQHVSGHNTPHDIHDTLFGEEVRVSSSHHQLMIPTKDAETIAYIEDHGWNFTGERGFEARPKIESEVLWYDHSRSLCFQGHPEWYSPASTQDYFFRVLEKLYG